MDLKHVLRFAGNAGKSVPWSGEERAAEIKNYNYSN